MKYLSLKKAKKQPAFRNSKLQKFVSYKILSKEIENIDIGKLKKINGQEKIGFLGHLLNAYFFQHQAENISCNPKGRSFLFALAIDGDAAPAVGMTIPVSFLNVGEMLPSSKKQFLLFEENVKENSITAENFLGLLVNNLKYLESKVFEVENATKKVKVEFKITELPNDMKMLSAHFTTFANANQSEANDYKKSFGISSQYSWRPFPYSKRVHDASKVAKKKNCWKKKNYQIQQNIYQHILENN